MFNSNILDVAIGLLFVFLTLSLICSSANEGIETFMKQRAKNLEKGIRELLGDLLTPAVNDSPQKAATNPAPDGQAAGPGQQAPDAANGNRASAGKPRDFVEAFYNHGLINSLYRGKYGETPLSQLPSYIPAANFALAVLDLRKSPNIILPRNLQSALDTFEMKAKGDLNVLQRELEGWFDSSMDRVSGWYKRKAQIILAGLGLVVAIAINADAIQIAQRLSTDSNLRQSVARIAEEAAKHPPQTQTPQPISTTPGASNPGDASPQPTETPAGQTGSPDTQPSPVDQIRADLAGLDGVGLPLGWHGFMSDFRAKRAAQAKILQQQGKTPAKEGRFAFYMAAGVEAVRVHFIGWAITALAVSLGAPFWFDILNKFMVVRSTIKPREKSKEEKSKDPTGSK